MCDCLCDLWWQVAEEGSRVVGVISSDNVRTLQDRLAASQEESVAIVSQMRASIARREGLLTRYKVSNCTNSHQVWFVMPHFLMQ